MSYMTAAEKFQDVVKIVQNVFRVPLNEGQV